MPARFADFVALYGSKPAANVTLYVSRRDRYVYITNPKVACSTIKATLNTMEAARRGVSFTLSTMEEVHDRDHSILLTPRQLGYGRFNRMMADPSVARFSFVRDPVKRFCSAYLSKLAEGKRGSPHYARLREVMGFRKNYPLSLEEFANAAAEDETVRDIDPHWRLQRTQIAWDLVDYTFIGRHDHFAEDFATLAARLYGARTPVEIFDTRSRFGRYTEAPKLAADITEDLRRVIHRAYEADYDMLSEIEAAALWRRPPEELSTRLRRMWREFRKR